MSILWWLMACFAVGALFMISAYLKDIRDELRKRR